MTDYPQLPLSPADEDPVVHRYLARLSTPEPAPGFDRRILVNVWGPAPAWVRSARARITDHVDSGRVWFVLGALAAGSLIPVAVAITAFGVWGSQMSWVTGRIAPELWAAMTAAAGAGLGQVTNTWARYMPSQSVLVVAVLVWVPIAFICVVGLRRMLRGNGVVNS